MQAQYAPVAHKWFRLVSARKLSLLAVALFWPAIVIAVPIVGPQQVTGWDNDRGIFVVDFNSSSSSVLGQADPGVASYSTATSLFSFSAGSIRVCRLPQCTIEGAADVRIDATVQETGTVSGDLIAGTLTATAGAPGFPAAGIAPGELLFVGNAIDSAAVDVFFSTSFLFEVVYVNPVLSDLAHYLTLWGPWPPAVWREGGTPAGAFKPWGVSWEDSQGFTEYTLAATFQLPEPSSLALLGIALAGLGFGRRKRIAN